MPGHFIRKYSEVMCLYGIPPLQGSTYPTAWWPWASKRVSHASGFCWFFAKFCMISFEMCQIFVSRASRQFWILWAWQAIWVQEDRCILTSNRWCISFCFHSQQNEANTKYYDIMQERKSQTWQCSLFSVEDHGQVRSDWAKFSEDI